MNENEKKQNWLKQKGILGLPWWVIVVFIVLAVIAGYWLATPVV